MTNNKLSIDMQKLLKQTQIFRKEIEHGLEILEREEKLTPELRFKRMSWDMDISKSKNSFSKVLEILNTLEIMLTQEAILTDFDILSNFLIILTNRFQLNDNMKKNIIFDFIERNIKIGMFRENALIIEQRELLKYQSNGKPIDLDNLDKYGNLLEDSKKITKDMQESHFIIKSHYLDKRQKTGELKAFSIEDVELIEVALRLLKVNKDIRKGIIKSLSDKVNKETKAFSNLSVNVENKPKLSKKEYHEIDIELRKYFYFNSNVSNVNDLNNSILIYRPLTERDKIRCVFLLRKAGYDISTIETFLNKVEVENLKDINFIKLYKKEYVLIFSAYSLESNLDNELTEANEIATILNSLDKNSLEYLEWNEELKRLTIKMLEKISSTQKKDYVKKRVKFYEQLENWK